MRVLKWAGLIVALALLAIAATIVTVNGRQVKEQDALASFYLPPDTMPTTPGVLLRSEPLTAADGTPVEVAGATALRILYSTQRPDGAIAVSGGMVFLPDRKASDGGRPVLAWAHGTVGQGDACAPSRSKDPTAPIASWLPLALARGWAVVATDYAGLGTAGPNLYLVGSAEASDVMHSVRAAASLPSADLSRRMVVMGHSQGGHAALWTGKLARTIDPSISLLGVAAIAPAAELPSIMRAQWNTPVAWVIGPEVMTSWPVVDPRLTRSVLSDAGARQTDRMAQACINSAAIEGLARTSLGQTYFDVDPLDEAPWESFATAQTPSPLPASMPVFLAQSTADDVVLAWPNAKMQRDWCAAGSTITAEWLGKVSHMETGLVAGPSAIQWAAGRFAGERPPSGCSVPPPIEPTAPTTPAG